MPAGRVTTILLMGLHFMCGVAGGGYLDPIWEKAARAKGRTEFMVTLNQVLLRGILSCWGVFEEEAHFSTSLRLLLFVKNISLINPSLYPS